MGINNMASFIFLANIVLGLFLILRPVQVIELQKRFYLKINWRMEPVNMALEIRNTRIMGFMLMGAVIALGMYVFISGLKIS